MFHYAVIFGLLANVAGSSAYAWDTLKGKTKPNRVTWFLWALAPFIGTLAAVTQGVTWAALPVFAAGFCPFMIFIASFIGRQGTWKLGRLDWICGGLSLLALALWLLTRNPNVAIIFAILSDAIAALPTYRKCWTNPETETIWAYAGGVVSALSSFLAVKEWTFPETAFPLYLTVLCLSLSLLVLRKKRPPQRAGKAKSFGP